MPLILWDACALVKHYVTESGSDTVQAIFAAVPLAEMALTFIGYSETFAILLRRLNQGVIRRASFTTAASALETEFLFSPSSTLLSVDDSAILASLALIQKHNLNSTDAAILTIFQRYLVSTENSSAVLVTAGKRLLRAAAAEGLVVIDPETLPATDVPVFLASV